MKQHQRGSREPHFIDPDFVEALDENDSRRRSNRQAERKTGQFCRQVQRALNLALADRGSSDGLDGLVVDEVSPAPDCGRLLVSVIIPDGLAVTEVLDALGRQTPWLRAEVASTITRKRAPELSFVPVHLAEGGGDE